MKKVALTLASIAAIATFAPEASAIPAFARQVGMACSACHYQHFPVLNAFGRSFKQGGYTMIGAEEKVEGEGVSLPATLNAAVVGYFQYSKTNGSPSTSYPTGTNDGQVQLPQQVSLFMGGRGGENFGFEAETNLNGSGASGQAGGTGTGNAGLIRFKVPFVVEAGGLKTLIVPYSTANGAADSFEILNTGAVNVHTFNQSAQSIVSAAQYIGTATSANGVALVTSNENFFANISKYGQNSGDGTAGGLNSNYVRAAWTTGLIPGFDSAIGFQNWSGASANSSSALAVSNLGGTYTPGSGVMTLTSGAVAPVASTSVVNTQATAIDAQMMGDVFGDMPLLVVASYATAPVTTGVQNQFNTGTLTRSAFNVGAELGIVKNVATVQVAYRNGQSGIAAADGSNATDNAFMIGATYAIALNARLELTYASLNGTLYNTFPTTGTQTTTIDLAMGF